MESLEGLKVGDKVILNSRYYKSIQTVSRITKTLVVLDNKATFRKRDGYAPGYTGFFIPSIHKATKEEIEYLKEKDKRDRLIQKIKDYPLEKLSTNELENIYQIINN